MKKFFLISLIFHGLFVLALTFRQPPPTSTAISPALGQIWGQIEENPAKAKLKKSAQKLPNPFAAHFVNHTESETETQTSSSPPGSPDASPGLSQNLWTRIQSRLTYPRSLQARGVKGTVRARFKVVDDGQVTAIEILNESPPELVQLVQNAIHSAAPLPREYAQFSYLLTFEFTLR